MVGSASRNTLPPSPPSPPSGPPRGTNFSRRKLTHPAPPSPPLTKTSISSTNIAGSRGAGKRAGAGQAGCWATLTNLSSPLRSKRTYPSDLAKRVWSTPIPTLTPALKRVPRWRTRMLPAVTNWPPKRLTPSICGLESRPFLELPTPFLWAMRLHLDLRDAHRRQGLPVPAVTPIVLPPLELDHDDLAPLSLGEHLARHPGRRQRLGFNRHLAVLVDQQDLVELHRAALGLAEPLNLDHLSRSHPVLLATRCDHRFHVLDLAFGDVEHVASIGGGQPPSRAVRDPHEQSSDHIGVTKVKGDGPLASSRGARPLSTRGLPAQQAPPRVRAPSPHRGAQPAPSPLRRRQVLGEPLAQEQPRAMHPRLHRGKADVQRLGDLGI